MQFKAYTTLTSISTQSVDALVFTSMIRIGTFIKFFDEICRKACLLDGTIGHKLHEKFIRVGPNGFGNFIATEFSQNWTIGQMAVTYFEVIVNTIVVIFNFKRLKFERHLKIIRNCDFPNTLFIRSIVFRIVRTL